MGRMHLCSICIGPAVLEVAVSGLGGVGGAGWQDESLIEFLLPLVWSPGPVGAAPAVLAIYGPASSGPSSFCPIQINWPTLLDLSGTFPVLALQVLYPGTLPWCWADQNN